MAETKNPVGKKKCVKCGEFIGVRTAQCSFCNYVYYEKKPQKEKVIKTYSKLKKNRKVCSSCGTIVSIRVPICPKCKKEFPAPKEGENLWEVIKLMERMGEITMKDLKALENPNTLDYKETKFYTPDEYADMIIKKGPNRARNLLIMAKDRKCWRHVNWKKVAGFLNESISNLPPIEKRKERDEDEQNEEDIVVHRG